MLAHHHNNKRVPSMRVLLFALFSLFSLGVLADPGWKPFPHDQSTFDYSGDKLREAWPRLTRGFGDYPFPDAAWVQQMASTYPEALQQTLDGDTGFSGQPGEAQQYAERLQDVWRAVFRGDFAAAKAQGMALGVGGQVPAMYAQVIYAMFLADNREEKHRLLEEVVTHTKNAGDLAKADSVALFGGAYAKARLGEELSVPVVLKRGYTTQIPKELDALLSAHPKHPYALALYGGYHAGVIRKVGKMVGRMTYGATADKMELYFQRSFQQSDDLPIGHYEYANALNYVYGDDEEQKALEHLQRAVSLQPANAMEALEIAHAKKLLGAQSQASNR